MRWHYDADAETLQKRLEAVDYFREMFAKYE